MNIHSVSDEEINALFLEVGWFVSPRVCVLYRILHIYFRSAAKGTILI